MLTPPPTCIKKARTLSCLGLLGFSLVSACSDSHLSRLARTLTCLGLLGLSLVSACSDSHLSRLARTLTCLGLLANAFSSALCRGAVVVVHFQPHCPQAVLGLTQAWGQ
eukprot:932529-Pleurochrysis_carterae.AAC.1